MVKQFSRAIFGFCALYSMVIEADVVPYIAIRSQSVNAARELVLWQSEINLFDMCGVYGSCSITPEYTRSFKPERIAQWLFCDALVTDCCCDDGCAAIKIRGSTLDDRAGALMAENFFLPDDYQSVVVFDPRIYNFLVDFNFYFGLDRWFHGLYFRVHAPIVHTRWDLNFCETMVGEGEADYPLGYFDEQINVTGGLLNYYGVPRADLINTFEDFVYRCATPNLVRSDVTFSPLKRARMSRCGLTDNRLSEIQLALGWNFWLDCDSHCGLQLCASIPTGTRPQGHWLFEPIVGNGKHAELGVGLSGHWCFWCNEDECKDFCMYVDANITHLFKVRQCRTFDLIDKPLSRYMLAMKMTKAVHDLKNVAGTPPTYQFAKEYTPLANLTTMPIDVSVAVQADIVLKFAYTTNNFQFDFGYNFWARSCEKIEPRFDICGIEENTWSLKGDAFVYGFTANNNAPDKPVSLSVTEHCATIFEGTNTRAERLTNVLWYYNPGVDSPKDAYDGLGAQLFNWYFSDHEAIKSSFNSVLISRSDIDIAGARTRGQSHKFFGNVGYIWKDHEECLIPYFGVGVEVEFGKQDKGCCRNVTMPHSSNQYCTKRNTDVCNERDRCKMCAITQWGVWVKGGISFCS